MNKIQTYLLLLTKEKTIRIRLFQRLSIVFLCLILSLQIVSSREINNLEKNQANDSSILQLSDNLQNAVKCGSPSCIMSGAYQLLNQFEKNIFECRRTKKSSNSEYTEWILVLDSLLSAAKQLGCLEFRSSAAEILYKLRTDIYMIKKIAEENKYNLKELGLRYHRFEQLKLKIIGQGLLSQYPSFHSRKPIGVPALVKFTLEPRRSPMAETVEYSLARKAEQTSKVTIKIDCLEYPLIFTPTILKNGKIRSIYLVSKIIVNGKEVAKTQIDLTREVRLPCSIEAQTLELKTRYCEQRLADKCTVTVEQENGERISKSFDIVLLH